MDNNTQLEVKGFQSKIKEFYSVRLGQAFQRFSEEPKVAKKSLKGVKRGLKDSAWTQRTSKKQNQISNNESAGISKYYKL